MTKRITDIHKAHFTTTTIYAQRRTVLYQQVVKFARKPGWTASPRGRREVHSVDTDKDETVWVTRTLKKKTTVRAPISASRPHSIDVVMVCWFALLPSPQSCLAQDAQGSDRVWHITR